jgi:DNA polymerase I-like protein with 3'-5' exonuclease and polymerase domains
MSREVIGLDIESVDPLLKTQGYSWKYGQGKILCTALYYEAEDKVMTIAGLHNDNCPYDKSVRTKQNKIIEDLLRNENVSIVGANLQYDIGWLLYEYGMTTYDVKCSFIDVLQAESILNEFDIHTLETVSKKYLNYGKKKERIEEWVKENVSAKGDFRKYLEDAPWDLLQEYVEGDAKNPVKVWRKQLTKLKEQDLCKRCKLEFDCILPILQITMNGYPVNVEQKEKNRVLMEKYVSILEKEFKEKFNVPKFRVTANRDIASFCDERGIPYRCKITLKGNNGEKFKDYKETDNAYSKAKRIVSSFRFEKSVPVAYVPKELADRTCDLLKEEGFMLTCSPNVDKKFFASARENYPEIGIIADWKLAKGILSKILGTEYDRFINKDKDGVYRIHPQFNLSDTISLRLSSVKPNGQQIPSKGGFTITINGEEVEVSFPKLTRALFIGNPNNVLWKIDYGQIEYRLICNIACGKAGEEVRAEYAKNPKLDFHQYVVDLTKLSRKYAKNMSFGVSFGMGLKSMAETFGWTLEQAEEISEQYHRHMPFVQPTLELVGEVAKKRGYIKTVYGNHARLPNPNKSYTMLNRYTQGSGAECLKLSIVNAYKEGLWEKINVVNTIHDELNGSIPVDEEHIKDVMRMAEIMRTSMPNLRVPLEAEMELGDNWANTKTVDEWLEIKNTDEVKWNSLSDNLRKAILIAEKVRA